MPTEREHIEYIHQLEGEVKTWHGAYDALKVERDTLIERVRELERQQQDAKQFDEFYRNHKLRAFTPYEDDPTFQAYAKSEVDAVMKSKAIHEFTLRALFYRALAIGHDLHAAIIYHKAGGLFTPGDAIDRKYARKLKANRECLRKAFELEGRVSVFTCTLCGKKTATPIYVKHPDAKNPTCPDCARTWKPKGTP